MEKIKSKESIKIEIIIPTLNEEEGITRLLQNIRSQKISFPLSFLVTDAGSTDRTIEICKKENIRVIPRKGKGKGIGMREAAEFSDADILVFLDGDGTYQIDNLELFLEPLINDSADMVIGSRMIGKREAGTITSFNMLGNAIFNRTINFALKSKITDSQSGCRAIRRETFRDLFLFSTEFDIEVEMTAEAIAKGYRVVDIPITYLKRENSKTKLNPIRDGAKIAKTLFFIIMNFRPLLFFSILSLIIFGISVYPASIVLYEKLTTGNIIHLPAVIFASLLIMTAVILLVLGILSELIVNSRRRIEYLIKQKSTN